MESWKDYTSGLYFQDTFLDKASILKFNPNDNAEYLSPIFQFMKEWLSEEDSILVHTSGSTGQPKSIRLKKNAMVLSAKNTGKYLGLKKGDSALLNLPVKFIAGKMMVVRSFVLGLKLYASPVKSLVSCEEKIDFAAMTPHQVQVTLDKNPDFLNRVSKLIIGGAPLSKKLEKSLDTLNCSCFSTYGMTETSTHIALKALNGTDKSSAFEVVNSNIKISLNKDDCLCIDAPGLIEFPIETTDIVHIIDDTHFEWRGRMDNIINSAGIKLNPERIEAKIQEQIAYRFFFIGIKDSVFYERVALVIENESIPGLEDLLMILNKNLSKYELPQYIYRRNKMIETENGKINRRASFEGSEMIYKKA